MKRILNWFRLRKLESDLDRELTYHIDRRVVDLIHSGLPEPEARRRVALELGGSTQIREEVRDRPQSGFRCANLKRRFR